MTAVMGGVQIALLAIVSVAGLVSTNGDKDAPPGFDFQDPQFMKELAAEMNNDPAAMQALIDDPMKMQSMLGELNDPALMKDLKQDPKKMVDFLKNAAMKVAKEATKGKKGEPRKKRDRGFGGMDQQAVERGDFSSLEPGSLGSVFKDEMEAEMRQNPEMLASVQKLTEDKELMMKFLTEEMEKDPQRGQRLVKDPKLLAEFVKEKAYLVASKEKRKKMSRAEHREELVDFYTRYGIAYQDENIEKALDKFKGKEDKMFKSLHKKYDAQIKEAMKAKEAKKAKEKEEEEKQAEKPLAEEEL